MIGVYRVEALTHTFLTLRLYNCKELLNSIGRGSKHVAMLESAA